MGARCQVREQPPVTIPVHTVTEKRVFVPLDAELTQPCPIEPAGRPSEATRVAAARRLALEDCNRQLERIRAIQGTEVR